jgi:TRAP-type C4-dicarboxylate transport system permease small subunit
MGWFAGIILMGMMFLTVADVVLRYFRRPILGAYELVTFSGAIVVVFALPLTSWNKGHITVDILMEYFPRTRHYALHVVTRLMGMMFFVLLGWNLLVMGNNYYKTAELTLNLGLPLYPFAYALGICCMIEVLVLAWDAIESVLAGGRHE